MFLSLLKVKLYTKLFWVHTPSQSLGRLSFSLPLGLLHSNLMMTSIGSGKPLIRPRVWVSLFYCVYAMCNLPSTQTHSHCLAYKDGSHNVSKIWCVHRHSPFRWVQAIKCTVSTLCTIIKFSPGPPTHFFCASRIPSAADSFWVKEHCYMVKVATWLGCE